MTMRQLFLLLCLLPLIASGQVSVFHCAEPTPPDIVLMNNNPTGSYCFNFRESIHYNLSATENHHLTGEKHIAIKPGFTAGSYTQGNGRFVADLAPISPWSDIVLLTPNAQHAVPRAEKFEIGMVLPPEIESKIEAFIADPDDPTGINPYLEWKIRVRATFTHQSSGAVQKVDGFFYQEYSRNQTDPDPEQWDWNEEPTPYSWRVRFAPEQVGSWQCSVEIELPSATTVSPTFYFTVVPSNNLGFMFSSITGRYFKRGGETFYPAGTNLRWPYCEDCQSLTPWTSTPVKLLGYLQYQDRMQSLRDNNGNYFRMINAPWAMEIEFDKLGNYTDRLNQAWEIDRILEHAKSNDLYIHYNLQVHYTFENKAFYNMDFWDWHPDPLHNSRNKYAYPVELGLTEVAEFFTDPWAKAYYTQRLRYYISRYGYSTNIAVFELMSEINNAGNINETVNGKRIPIFSPYGDDVNPSGAPHDQQQWQQMIQAWHNTMSLYIKDHLDHKSHMLGVNYTGQPGDYDNSFHLNKINVASYNWYSRNVDKYTGKAAVVENYRNDGIVKPIFHSEAGPVGVARCAPSIEYVKDVWMRCFDGTAGALSWGYQDSVWFMHYYGLVNSFMNDVDLDVNFGSVWTSDQDLRSDNKVEAVYLRESGKDKAMGAISNRTMNFYSLRDQSVDVVGGELSSCLGNEPDDEYEIPLLLAHDNQKKVRIKGMRAKKYFVNYFNMHTGAFLYQTTDWGPSVTLEYPALTPTSPLILFQAHTNNNEFRQLVDSMDDYTSEAEYMNLLNQDFEGNLIVTTTELDNVDFQILPNPNDGQFRLRVDGNDAVYTVSIYNANGQLIFCESLVPQVKMYDFSHLESGLYLVLLKSNTTILRQKMVINK